MLISVLLLIGLACLYFGAEWLVKGAADLALKLGISPLAVGLTIVAYGTSMPEMFVSVQSGLDGMGDIAVGNVVGSNIMNIAMILGVSAIIRPLKIQLQLLKFDVPLMIAISAIFILICLDSRITRPEAILLFAGAATYTVIVLKISKPDAAIIEENIPHPKKQGKPVRDIGLIILGLLTLVLGSKAFLAGAIALAKTIGISEAVIGLTIVAAGTSLPELATSVIASFKRHSDISVGNIVGSNIFNILAIIGVAGTITPMDCPGIGRLDLAYMMISALLLFPFMKTGRILNRIEGGALLLVYISYLYFLWPK